MSFLSTIFGRAPWADRTARSRALLVGTARSIRQLRHALRESEEAVDPIGCVLIAPQHKAGAVGLPVFGTADDLELICQTHRFDVALVSLPVAMSAAARRVASDLAQRGKTVRVLPTLDDQVTGRVGRLGGRFDPRELLDRPAHRLDQSAIASLLKGKRVMITGAGGSIGSELAAIVAGYEPSALLLMERSENNLFEIQRQLVSDQPELDVRTLLHDVAVADRTLELCAEHRPQIIFHAAAHKHVPMMEEHPRQAVANNVFGTKAIADAAHATGCERFVMISTDKAVNPTSVMGATKRLAELYVQAMNADSDCHFTMVRFGNVLGSACSVVPIWTDQLCKGGPITVTDPRMTRYFMTINEAASLVIQAATLDGTGGQVLLLDMGQPVKVLDLARRFVELHGLEPDRDVPIVFTGARPGEKLFEELAYDAETMQPTDHESVRVWQTTPPSAEWVALIVETFSDLRANGDRTAILSALKQAVPEMQIKLPGQVVTLAPRVRARSA